MQELLQNKILLSVVVSLFSAQVLKVLTVFITEKKFDTQRLKGTGGMPSSHSASVMALATSVGFKEGFSSTAFSIAAVFAFVVMYDAVGIRQAAGQHAKRLNELSEQLVEIAETFKSGFESEKLKTLLGHTLPQVFFGALLGIGISLLFFL